MSTIKFGKIEIKGVQYTAPQPVVDAFRSVLKNRRNDSMRRQDILRVDDFDDEPGEDDEVNMSSHKTEAKKLKKGRKTPFDWQSEEGLKESRDATDNANTDLGEYKMRKDRILNSLGIY